MNELQPGLAAVLGRIPSGIFVLTARKGKHETGMLTSWVQQCAFEPPHISVVIKQGRPLHAWLEAGAYFVLNVVAEAQKNLLAHFGRGFALDESAFKGLDTKASEHGQPILTAALGFLECKVTSRLPVGDHELIVAKVCAGELLADTPPMVHIRKNGYRY